MRYALAVQPKNYLLFGCHFVNFNAQLTQMYRWYDYWYMGGQDRWAKIRAQAAKLEGQASSVADQAKSQVGAAVNEVKKTVS
ncbi:small nuclear ribonucleoprotein B and B' [Capronia coronata CBS 617.96]|uniref:Mitochondrial pyruvate carrier n=1 Tax=Capronia coronata CBS 617.96 TaxID=1182541 RepID=W9Z3Q5_9EURO|nr:small nuclear ribonucleoprotein B and B' [Capronia coronata CBS 617.96]EXJ96221.1 small nuclear ribonucleoprotein B and B' [Capronia coronata CBS 617.96]